MTLTNETSEIFVPDGMSAGAALARTTALGVVAHQDDLEILACPGILGAFRNPDEWFAGCVCTNGSGSARAGVYADCTDDEMRAIRREEQKKAAVIGEYAAVALLDYPSSSLKTAGEPAPLADILALLQATRPEVVYTHNLADKHDTHVAVALRLISAIRQLPPEQRPRQVFGCEVWRDLDWMCDEDKTVFRTDAHENLSAALLGLYDSQIAGGKRYDLATMGRRRANATFFASHDVDDASGLLFAVDITPLTTDSSASPQTFIQGYIDRFAQEVNDRIQRLGG